MFTQLSERLTGIFDGLRRRGALTEGDVDQALREIRIALLEADVALPVAKDFIKAVKEKAVGAEVIKSVSPGQMVVKLVHEHLVATLGETHTPLDLNAPAPVVFMMVGLQGSGKTTSTGKLAKRLAKRENKKVLMASLDVYRPAAQQQLATLGEQTGIATLPIIAGENPQTITKRALKMAQLEGYDVLFLDTAGRTHVDAGMMQEAQEIQALANPHEILLVADAMTGQDAVHIASSFKEALPLTGIVLTRIDSDARGGAALSIRAVTGCPIKILGVGEKLDDLEDFHPSRLADRILGMGDIVSLVEKASEAVDQAEAEKLGKKLEKGKFDLEDLAAQFKQMRKMGGMASLMGMIPGLSQMKDKVNPADTEKTLKRQEAIIQSMTPKERRYPKLLNASRKKRVAAGSGTSVQDVNRLLKQYEQMSKMLKKFGKMDKKSLKRNLPSMLGH